MSALDQPKWQHPLSRDLLAEPDPLRAALLTTFEPPDPNWLVEDLFPAWLGLTRELEDDGPGRNLFLVDLRLRLQALRGKIAIFSSAGAVTPHWLWHHVHLCQVGSIRKAVQHAKLWLVHREAGHGSDQSTLEIVIGSTNLTRAALQSQIQAGWRAVVPLEEKPAACRLASWGVFSEFLKELGRQAGRNGQAAVAHWLKQVLPRAQCPHDVRFIASVPGPHENKRLRRAESAWGVAGLGWLKPVARTRRVELSVPCVGSFDREALEQWAARARTAPNRMALAWIPKDHPWGKRGWSMPSGTARTLRESKVNLKEFPGRDRASEKFHPDWDRTDDRWLHSKLYWIKDARQRRLLITSANWSQAAWGKAMPRGGLSIENFELGVAFDCPWAPLERFDTLEAGLGTQRPSSRLPEPAIPWSEGSWNGKLIRLAARLSGTEIQLLPVAEVKVNGKSQKKPLRWRRTGGHVFEASICWRERNGTPAIVLIETGGKNAKKVEVLISDVRPRGAVPPETFEGVGQDEAERLELRLLEERYGGRAADDPEPSEPRPEDRASEPPQPGPNVDTRTCRPPANYEVTTIVAAREKFGIVTNWAHKLAAVPKDDRDGARAIIEDGKRLLALWQSPDHAGTELATRIAAGELHGRLNSKRCR